MSTIEATLEHGPSHSRKSACRTVRARAAVLVLTAIALTALIIPRALAGQSATGELAFHPCTQCHPVTLGADGQPSRALPIGMTQHVVELEVHDILGEGDTACLACHDDPSENPGMLLLADGTFVDVTGDVSRVCQRCHFEKYREWQVGVHGKNEPKCSAAGCHDPHTPSWIYVGALPPFQGTGMEVRAVGEWLPFKPLAGPPTPPAVLTPAWLAILTALGAVVSAGMLGYLILGRFKR
ncbi:MAG: cytochrome c3 family protein [Coriobacteriia bacterium]|nr:cytochrome c3 family protein [Coriobacteriia bacterium]